VPEDVRGGLGHADDGEDVLGDIVVEPARRHWSTICHSRSRRWAGVGGEVR
jgi:hypothetical protein